VLLDPTWDFRENETKTVKCEFLACKYLEYKKSTCVIGSRHNFNVNITHVLYYHVGRGQQQQQQQQQGTHFADRVIIRSNLHTFLS